MYGAEFISSTTRVVYDTKKKKYMRKLSLRVSEPSRACDVTAVRLAQLRNSALSPCFHTAFVGPWHNNLLTLEYVI